MLKVLLIGNGAREHCIAEALVNSNSKLFSLMGSKNPGISELSGKSGGDFEIGRLNPESSLKTAEKFNVDLAIIGPEAPLSLGVADVLRKKGIQVLGPNRDAAMIETSKGFARELLKKYEIKGFTELSYPDFKVFNHSASIDEIRSYLAELKRAGQDYVLKPDGLTGGKGVKVKGDHFFTDKEALNYCSEVLHQSADSRIVIEEKLEGEEFSLQCFVDGKNIVAMPPVQDHKRAFSGDIGNNTGGMGSYSYPGNLPFLKDRDLEEAKLIVQKTVDALNKEQLEFRGILYGGFIATKNSVKLIEYNARFGDPETMNVVPLIKNGENSSNNSNNDSSNFSEICMDVAQGNMKKKKIKFDKKATVCKYLVPEGYPDFPPDSPVGNEKIAIDRKNLAKYGYNEDSLRFYWSSVSEKNNEVYSSSSRTLAVLGIHDNIEEAEKIAQSGVNCVDCAKGKLRYRKDIGTKELIQKRIDHMRSLRGK